MNEAERPGNWFGERWCLRVERASTSSAVLKLSLYGRAMAFMTDVLSLAGDMIDPSLRRGAKKRCAASTGVLGCADACSAHRVPLR
jgi:hypothetical protein